MNGIGVCTRLLPGDPRGPVFMGMTEDLERSLKRKHHEKVQALASKEMKFEDYSIRGMRLFNGRRDYCNSNFGRSAAEEIIDLIPGAPVMEAHDGSRDPEGLFIEGKLVPDDAMRDGFWGEMLYTLPNDARGIVTRDRADGGYKREVSIGWRCHGATCSICKEHIYECPHIPGDIYRTGGLCSFEFSGITNVLEGSFVYRGGQKDTHTFIPQGADEPLAAVAGAASRLMRTLSGDVWWDEIHDNKIEGARDMKLLPREIRAAVANYSRATGFGLMCAEAGERTNTQAVVVSRQVFGDDKVAAKRWCRQNEFRVDFLRTTAKDFVFDQFPKEMGDAKSFEDIAIGDEGVTARICKRVPKEQGAERSARNGADELDEYLEQVAGASQ